MNPCFKNHQISKISPPIRLPWRSSPQIAIGWSGQPFGSTSLCEWFLYSVYYPKFAGQRRRIYDTMLQHYYRAHVATNVCPTVRQWESCREALRTQDINGNHRCSQMSEHWSSWPKSICNRNYGQIFKTSWEDYDFKKDSYTDFDFISWTLGHAIRTSVVLAEWYRTSVCNKVLYLARQFYRTQILMTNTNHDQTCAQLELYNQKICPKLQH